MLKKWPAHPVIYEVNTWVWLGELSRRYQRPLTLAHVPDDDWDAVTSCAPDAVWLMGVWERSPWGREIALHNESLLASCREALPDLTPDDIVGSPYCIRRYRVDDHLGGPAGLAEARRQLARRGARLILDLVPNHLAPDHPWVKAHPDYFIQGTPEDLRRNPQAFLPVGEHIFAHGRDPYFSPWPDVVQVDAFSPGYRQALSDTLLDLAGQCDGVRCDMAMLLLNRVFLKTWGPRPDILLAREFWEAVIPPVKRKFPGFLMIAEAYWDLEWELQQQGFGYCYDKRLYDRLRHGNAEAVRQHLQAGLDYQSRLVRFIENHDEPRAAAVFDDQQERVAAVTIATLPGATLFHEGQFEGRRVRLPVFLQRRPAEPGVADFYPLPSRGAGRESAAPPALQSFSPLPGGSAVLSNPLSPPLPGGSSSLSPLPPTGGEGQGEGGQKDLAAAGITDFYRTLLAALAQPVFKKGEWCLLECHGWPDNQSYLNLVAWTWSLEADRRLIIVNLSAHRSQALIPLPWQDLPGCDCHLTDPFTAQTYTRPAQDLHHPGLFVDLQPWQFHFFCVD